jgi:hypothetical protein
MTAINRSTEYNPPNVVGQIDDIFFPRINCVAAPGGKPVLVIARIDAATHGHLAKAVDALGALGFFLRGGERGQEDGGQDGNDSDDDQQFDQRKRISAFSNGTA